MQGYKQRAESITFLVNLTVNSTNLTMQLFIDTTPQQFNIQNSSQCAETAQFKKFKGPEWAKPLAIKQTSGGIPICSLHIVPGKALEITES